MLFEVFWCQFCVSQNKVQQLVVDILAQNKESLAQFLFLLFILTGLLASGIFFFFFFFNFSLHFKLTLNGYSSMPVAYHFAGCSVQRLKCCWMTFYLTLHSL